MKKILVFIVICFSLLGITNTKLISQCPPGTSSQTFIFTVGGCDWIADICYQCPFTAHPNWFTVGKYKKVNSTCIGSVPADDVKDSIIAQMIDGRVWLYGLCDQ